MALQLDELAQEPHDQPTMVRQLLDPLVVGQLGVSLHHLSPLLVEEQLPLEAGDLGNTILGGLHTSLTG